MNTNEVMRRSIVVVALLFLLSAISYPVFAEENPATAKKGPDCSSAEHKKLQMLVGEWDVADNSGKVVGHNRLTPVFETCAVREDWTSVSGVQGTSLKFYDLQLGTYHAVWIDNHGIVLDLKGEFSGDELTFKGRRPSVRSPGVMAEHVIRWKRNGDGTLSQIWQVSPDDGATWVTLFEGLYTKQDHK